MPSEWYQSWIIISLVILLPFGSSLLRYFLRWWDFYKKAKTLPGTQRWTLPGLGDIYHFALVWDLIGMMSVVKKLVGKESIMKIWLGPILMIVVADPKLLQILVPHSYSVNKDRLAYGTMKSIFPGVFGRNGNFWRTLRRPLLRQLNPRDTSIFLEIWNGTSERLVRVLNSSANGSSVNIHLVVKRCALDIVCEAAMGVEGINETENNDFDFPRKITRLSEIATRRLFRPHLFFDVPFYWTSIGKESERLEKQTTRFCSYVLEKRKKQLGSNEFSMKEKEPQFYSDVILSCGQKWGLNSKKMSYLTKDIYLAGTDSSSTTIATCLAFLAFHSKYQEKVVEEMEEIFGCSERNPTLDDLKKMSYLEMCLKEALRHCAPAAVTRKLSKDIKIDDYILPKGAMLYFAFFLSHKDPLWWEKPHDFYPDHFREEVVAKRPKGVFMPFSAGARGCPGQIFAWQSMKVITSRLIRTYRFTTDHDLRKMRYHVLLTPQVADGYMVKMTHRKRQN